MTIEPVDITITVARGPGEAFRLFTEELASWWPRATHSVFKDKSANLALEGRLGGKIQETSAEGEVSEWGEVTLWNPPREVSFTWHPGGAPEEATRVVVSFNEAEGGRTRVRVVHDGWDARGAGAAAIRDDYETGWGEVFVNCFGGHCGIVAAA